MSGALANVILYGLKPYLVMAALLTFTALLAWGFMSGVRAGRLRPRFSTAVWVLNALLLASLTLPWAALLLPRDVLQRPGAQVWSGSDRRGRPAYALIALAEEGARDAAAAQDSSAVEGLRLGGAALLALALVLGAGVLWGGARLARSRFLLRRELEALPAWHSLGRVSLRVSDDAGSPFSATLGLRSYIIFPASFVGDRALFKLAFLHEARHLRAGDTVWVHFHEALAAAFFWNPLVRRLTEQLQELQEFACDESLVGQPGVCARDYGRCLLKAAESAVRARAALAGTTGMALGRNGLGIQRRIEMLLDQKRTKKTGGWFLASSAAVAFMATFTYAAQGWVQDKRLSMEEARELLKAGDVGAVAGAVTMPLELNELVLAKLNRFVGTPEGRRWISEAQLRMPQYEAMILRAMDQYKVPRELMAMPLVESGFRNDVVSPPPYRAAGIWQFIPQTARRYDLEVTAKRDDRLNPALETIAAMRYLRDVYEEFGDWRLAVKAYNEGEQRVRKLIAKYGTRDPWVLERLDTTEDYLSGVVAAAILQKVPGTFRAPTASSE